MFDLRLRCLARGMVRSEYPLTKNGKLWAAARDGELERVRELLADLADPNGHASTATGSTALHEALLAGHREVVDALLKAGARASVADSYGNTPLHACAASRAGDDPELTARLIAASGSDVRAKNSDGATALHLSALKGKPSMSRMLIEHGAPLHAVDRAGRDALSFAADAPTERALLELIGREVLDADKGAEERKWPSATPWYLAGVGKRVDDDDDEPLKPPPRSLAPPPPPPPPDEYWGKGRRGFGKGTRPGSAAARLHGDRSRHGVDATEAGSALGVAASMQERLVRAFLTADRDGTGSVSKRELYRAMRAAGVRDLASDDALRLFQEADTDGDGQLSFEEFARVARKVRPLLTHPSAQNAPLDRGAAGAAAAAAGMSKQTRAKLRRAFVAFDADGSGNISLSELAAAFRQCGLFVPDAKLRRMFSEADVDNSGAIDLAEFESLARRLLLPAKSSKAPPGAEPPGAGSATAKVFAALERGGTGRIAATELPHALKLLGIEADAPATERAVRDAVEQSGGAIDEPSFTALVHLLLSGDAEAQYAEETNAKKGGKKGGGDGYGYGGGRKGFGSAISAMATRAKEGEDKEAKVAARTEAEGVHARLAQAFALAASHDNGTVAAHEVGSLLWRSGVIADAQMLAALRPAPSQAAKRISFDALLRLAAQAADGTFLSAALLQQGQTPPTAAKMGTLLGKGTTAAEAAAAAAAAAGASDKRAMLLTVQRVVLSPWLAELQAVQSLFVIVRGELAPSAAMGGAAPLMLRSATQRKRGAQPLEVGLSAMLAGTAGLVEVELLHEPLASGAAHLLGSAQLELGRLYPAAPPASKDGSKGVERPLEYELPLYDARATHAATIHLSAQPHAALTPLTQLGDAAAAPAAAPAAAATAAGSAVHLAQVHSLEAQLAAMRHRADALAKENVRLARSQPRMLPHGMVGAGGHSSTGEIQTRHEPTDWRKSEVVALEASLARLKRKGEKAAVVRTVLESTRDEMAAMVEQEQKERAAAAAAREDAALSGVGIPTV